MNEVRYREAERRLWASVEVTPTEQRVQLGRTGTTVRVQKMGQGPTVVPEFRSCRHMTLLDLL